MYDGETDFNVFKNAFLYDACLFGWDDAQKGECDRVLLERKSEAGVQRNGYGEASGHKRGI